jgi:OFA family oxalate/formate antiporter-like MFS transporter
LLCGLGFGACFVLYAAQTSVQYGALGLARVYPLLFLFYGISGITGPPFGGFLFDLTGTFAVPMVVSLVLLLAGGIVCWKPIPRVNT